MILGWALGSRPNGRVTRCHGVSRGVPASLAPVTFPDAAICAREDRGAYSPYHGYQAAAIDLEGAGRNRRGAHFLGNVVVGRAGLALIPSACHANSIRHRVQLLRSVGEHVAHQPVAKSMDGLIYVD